MAPARPLPPRTLIQQLTIDGVLSDNQAAELKDFASRRDAIAHGMCADPPTPEKLDWLSRFALALARWSTRRLARHGGLVQRTTTPHPTTLLCHTSAISEYLWLEGGPYDAEEVLRDQFEDALDADIDEAVQESSSAMVSNGRAETDSEVVRSLEGVSPRNEQPVTGLPGQPRSAPRARGVAADAASCADITTAGVKIKVPSASSSTR